MSNLLEGHVVMVVLPGSTWGWLLGAALSGVEWEFEQHPDQPANEREKTGFLFAALRHAMAIGAPATLDESLAIADARIAALPLGPRLDEHDKDLISKIVQRIADEDLKT